MNQQPRLETLARLRELPHEAATLEFKSNLEIPRRSANASPSWPMWRRSPATCRKSSVTKAQIERAVKILGKFEGDAALVLACNHDFCEGPDSKLWKQFRAAADDGTCRHEQLTTGTKAPSPHSPSPHAWRSPSSTSTAWPPSSSYSTTPAPTCPPHSIQRRT